MNRAALVEDTELAQEQAERRALVDFATFVRLLWPVVEPAPLEWGWHMQAICDALQDLATGKIRHLVINIPPGFSKSLLACVFLPAWIWLQRPHERMLFLSHDGDLASRDSRRTRILLTSPEYDRLLQRIPRPWTFAKDQNEKVNFENSARGFRYCGSLTSGITGKRGDGIIIDDPHDAKEATLGSPERIAERMAETQTIFDQTLQSRMNDQRKGWILVIMQRLHENDLAGTLLKRGYDRLILPMRYDPDAADPRDLRRKPGSLLDPRRFPADVVTALETALGSQAAGQLQQRPQARGGEMFPVQAWLWLDRSAWPTVFEREAMGWDLAFGATESGAFHVGVYGALLKGKIYLGGEVRGRFATPALLDAMRAARTRWPLARGWYLEDRAAARPAVEMLTSEIPGLVLRQPDGDKVARAQSWQPLHAAGNLVLPCQCGVTTLHRHEREDALPGEPWAIDFAREHAAFPKAAIKDRIDAMGYLVNELMPARKATTQPKAAGFAAFNS